MTRAGFLRVICRLRGHKRPPLQDVSINTGRNGTATFLWVCARCGTPHATLFSDD